METQPGILARHCVEAGMIEKAVRNFLKAGQQEITRGAMTEAVAQLRKGLDVLSGVPEGIARQEQELDLQIALGNALIATSAWSTLERGAALACARELCEQLKRPALLIQVLVGQFGFHHTRGELEQAEQDAEQICHLGETHNDAAWKFFGALNKGQVCFYLGKFIDARVHQENALSSGEPKYSFVTPDDPHLNGMIHFSRTLLCLGHIEQARWRRHEALAKARRLSPFNLVWTLWQAWLFDWAIEGVRSANTMLQSADELVAISSEQGFPLAAAAGKFVRGWSLGAMGQAAEGIPLMLQGIAVTHTMDTKMLAPFILTALAEIYGMEARHEEGLDQLAEASKVIETTQERWAEAEMHRLRGTLLRSMREDLAAEDSYNHALAVARRQSAKFWELRATLDLARLWHDQGKCNEARSLLAPVYGWFTEGFDTPALQDAKALLDQLA